jgi:SAM-dependent methyltransferase
MASDPDDRRHAPATSRNRGPILEVLSRVLPTTGCVLEIASGTGEHAAWFAPRLRPRIWQPSDADAEMRASIAAHAAEAAAPNLRPPLALDVTAANWPQAVAAALDDAPLRAIVNINMIHISQWSAAEGLIAGAGQLLPAGGVLFLYGPFRIGGKHTAPSNEAFDRMLRAQDSSWGVRDLEAVAALAGTHGFALRERVGMPANNLSLIFERA